MTIADRLSSRCDGAKIRRLFLYANFYVYFLLKKQNSFIFALSKPNAPCPKTIHELSQKIFIFAEEVTLSQEEKLIFLRQLLTYIFSVFSFNTEEFITLTKQLPDMAQDVVYSTFDMILDEGIIKGREEAMLTTSVEDDFRWIIKMQEQSLEIAIIQVLSELPADFLTAFLSIFTTEKGAQLMNRITAMRALSGTDTLTAHLREALLDYGLSDANVDMYLSHLTERLKARTS